MKTRTRILLSFLTLVGLLLAACGPVTPPSAPEPTATPAPVSVPTETLAIPSPPAETPTALPAPAAMASAKLVFAPYEEPAVEVVPAIHHEPIAPDLSNVRVSFALSEAQQERLARDGFVVSPGVEKEFFTVYCTRLCKARTGRTPPAAPSPLSASPASC